MSENERNNNATETIVMFCKIVILIVFVYPLLHYTVLNRGQDRREPAAQDRSEHANNATHEANRTRHAAIPQPACPASHVLAILQDLCRDVYVRHEQCTPDDVHDPEKHKMPKSSAKTGRTGEPRGTIVGCVAAGLLLTSLGAAFLELYKAKSQAPVKTTKPTISRKCSLADLTVLKHNRKELVRRESIMEMPETGGVLKPTGSRPPPLYRRCSFPVGPSEFTYGTSYSTSYQESRRPSREARRLSIIDDRRRSIDCRKASVASIDNESPERRHWSRLVHRH